MTSPRRGLSGSPFPDDTGAAAPALAAALATYAAQPDQYAEALSSLCEHRLLVPVVAVLGEVEHDAAGLAHDKTSDMATVLLRGDDGRMALLGFTGLEALAAWDPEARPVPVAARDAARSAVAEGAHALLVDLAGPVRFVVEGDDLTGLAEGWTLARAGRRTVWVRPPDDPDDGARPR